MNTPSPSPDPPVGPHPEQLSLRRAVGADFRDAHVRQRLALVGVATWLIYEWGPGNETVTPWLLVRVVDRTDGAWVIPLTALIGFAFTALQQLASGFTALTGFSLFSRTAHAAWRRLSGDGDPPREWSSLGWGTRATTVFALGTTAVALAQIITTGEVGVRRHRRAVATSAVLCASMVAMIGAAGASLALIGRNVAALQGATDWILRVLGNPLLWIGLIVVTVGSRRIFTKRGDIDADNGGGG